MTADYTIAAQLVQPYYSRDRKEWTTVTVREAPDAEAALEQARKLLPKGVGYTLTIKDIDMRWPVGGGDE